MPAPGSRTPRRFPEPVRRRLEVATAMAWEALVDAHGRHALEFVTLFAGWLPLDEAVLRYLREMDVAPQMAAAVQTRVLVDVETLERSGPLRSPLPLDAVDEDEASGDASAWRRFNPSSVVREVKERHRRNEQVERWAQLAIARAEEGIIHVHIDNALTFVALLEPLTTLGRAVEEYIASIALAGGRAQAVFQRTMARLAEVHLPQVETAPGPEPEPTESPSPLARRRGRT